MSRRALLPALLLGALPLAACTSLAGVNAGGEKPFYWQVKPPVAFEMLRDNPKILIVDLRGREEFYGPLGHLAGAKDIPLEDLPFRLVELSSYRDETFLVYCRRDDDCGEQGMAVLVTSGYGDAVLMAGGVEAWVTDRFGTVEKNLPPDQRVAQ